MVFYLIVTNMADKKNCKSFFDLLVVSNTINFIFGICTFIFTSYNTARNHFVTENYYVINGNSKLI